MLRSFTATDAKQFYCNSMINPKQFYCNSILSSFTATIKLCSMHGIEMFRYILDNVHFDVTKQMMHVLLGIDNLSSIFFAELSFKVSFLLITSATWFHLWGHLPLNCIPALNTCLYPLVMFTIHWVCGFIDVIKNKTIFIEYYSR